MLALLVLALVTSAQLTGQTSQAPETVSVRRDTVTLRALLWRPKGHGPFPAVFFNHGSYRSGESMGADDPSLLGPIFARHGYVFLVLFRRGIGLSADRGSADGDLMARALAEQGQAGRNRVQMELLEHEELDDVRAALACFRARADVDPRRIAMAGHSFGGSLSLLVAARDPTMRALVIFGGAAASWDQSPELQARLRGAVERIRAPVFFIHAANDYSVAPGTALADDMQRLKMPHRLVIYPAFGTSTRAGHNLVYRSPHSWEADVFAFLDAYAGP